MSVAEPPSVTRLPLPDPGEPPKRRRPKIKKLRLFLLMLGLSALALVSTVFGMMMAVASDLGDLTATNLKNSELYDIQGREIGVLVNNKNNVFVPYQNISPAMRQAIISIEDKRFYTNSGVDIRGIARAFMNDVFGGGGTQGGSTITQQFVKNKTNQQNNRTIFEKLREAAMAYHLTRKWSKEKILTQYLNTIYFGNGAYGIESAARVYFGADHPDCGTRNHPACASELKPVEAALLAGMVANPSGYDPTTRWPEAMARRNVVLQKMEDQHYLQPGEAHTLAVDNTAPPVITPPQEQVLIKDPTDPTGVRTLNIGYFNNWVRQQLVDRYGVKVFGAGWKVRTTLDVRLQAAAEKAVRDYLGTYDGSRPTASMVVIDNDSGSVRAMVGGPDYNSRPFNLATQGQRQPGSAFKPFVLAAAIRQGISPNSTWESRKKIFDVPGTHGKEKFVVNNYEGNYSGISTLARATTFSDNSVYAEVGFKTGFKNIAHMAHDMGIRTPVSTNPAITLGGLKQGVSTLDMAHAYETFAMRGKRIEGSLGAPNGGPVGIRKIETADGKKTVADNKLETKEVFSTALADEVTPILQSVVSVGTGTKAQYGGFAAGKTGTTENYGDAWFVGYTDKYTVAVWVGYPDSVKSMDHDYGGAAVAGGTYPAEIWRDFIVQAVQIDAQDAAKRAAKDGKGTTTTPDVTTPVSPVVPSTSSGTGGTATPNGTSTTGGGTQPPAAPQTQGGTTQQQGQTQQQPQGGGNTTDPGATGGASPGTGGAAPPNG